MPTCNRCGATPNPYGLNICLFCGRPLKRDIELKTINKGSQSGEKIVIEDREEILAKFAKGE